MTATQPDFDQQRRDLVREIEAEIRETAHLTGCKRLEPKVREALLSVRREDFVPDINRVHSLENRALPLSEGQTISQPFIVALMTQLCAPGPKSRILEIGTGSGYQAAVLAEVAKSVYSIEYHDSLARSAEARLKEMGYSNVQIRSGDGTRGWPEEAPFDGIVVTASAPGGVPGPLMEQLAEGGRIVVPADDPKAEGLSMFGLGPAQSLWVGRKKKGGEMDWKKVLPVAFVPLVGGKSKAR